MFGKVVGCAHLPNRGIGETFVFWETIEIKQEVKEQRIDATKKGYNETGL